MNISNNKILITGGASGIGLGLAERFLRENNKVIICGRRKSALKEVSDKYPSVITRVCDLSVPEERVNLFNWISEEHSDLNILVNNAGLQQYLSVSDPDFFQRAHEEIVINIEAPVHLASLFTRLPSLNTDLGGKGVHDYAPPVSGFIEEVFGQIKEGRTVLTSGFSEGMTKAGPAELESIFVRMNAGGR